MSIAAPTNAHATQHGLHVHVCLSCPAVFPQLVAHGDMGLAWQAAEAAVLLAEGPTGADLVAAGAVEELAALLQVRVDTCCHKSGTHGRGGQGPAAGHNVAGLWGAGLAGRCLPRIGPRMGWGHGSRELAAWQRGCSVRGCLAA